MYCALFNPYFKYFNYAPIEWKWILSGTKITPSTYIADVTIKAKDAVSGRIPGKLRRDRNRIF